MNLNQKKQEGRQRKFLALKWVLTHGVNIHRTASFYIVNSRKVIKRVAILALTGMSLLAGALQTQAHQHELATSPPTLGPIWKLLSTNVGESIFIMAEDGNYYINTQLLEVTDNVVITLVSGSISPISQTIKCNSSAVPLAATAAKGGKGTYGYQWQRLFNSRNWTNIAGATALVYMPGKLTATIYYRLVSTSNEISVTSQIATNWLITRVL